MARTPDSGPLPWLVIGSAVIALGLAGAAIWTVFRGTGTTLSNRKDPAPEVPAVGSAPQPQWIWREGGSDQAVLRTFVNAFDGARGSIRVAVDDVGELTVNGVTIGPELGSARAAEIDLTPHLTAGPNEIRITARNSAGPAGIVAEIVLSDAARSTVVRKITDETWTDGDGRPAIEIAPLGEGDWGPIEGFRPEPDTGQPR